MKFGVKFASSSPHTQTNKGRKVSIMASAISVQLDYLRKQITKVPATRKYVELIEDKTKGQKRRPRQGKNGRASLFSSHGSQCRLKTCTCVFILTSYIVILFYLIIGFLSLPHLRIALCTRAGSPTPVKVEYFAAGFLALLVILVFVGVGSSLIVNVVGYIYPLYASILAIETTAKTDDTDWLTYWVVYGFFLTIEVFSDYLLFLVPFYYPFKLSFLLWCMLPQFKGANVVYATLIKPHVSKILVDDVDAALNKVASAAAAMASSATTAATQEEK
jgi:receptor expression-enhancing protein 5/6